jgi:hypothetical protein
MSKHKIDFKNLSATSKINFLENMNVDRAQLELHFAGGNAPFGKQAVDEFDSYTTLTQQWVLQNSLAKRDEKRMSVCIERKVKRLAQYWDAQ